MDDLTSLLIQDGYWRLSHNLVREFGFTKASILTDLVTKYDYYNRIRQLYEGRWFFYRREEMAENWMIQADAQRKILKELQQEGLIDFQLKGPIPQKNYYTINIERLNELTISLREKYKK